MEDEKNVSKISDNGAAAPEGNFLTKSSRNLGGRFLKFLLSLGGIVTFIFIVAAVSLWQRQNGVVIPGINNDGGITLSSKVAISSVGENAFGVLSDLSATSSDSNKMTSESSSPDSASNAMGQAVSPVGQGGGGSSDGVAVDMIYPYEPTYYVYTYKGADFTQNEAKMNVLKRVAAASSVSASTLTRSLDFNLFDLGKLDSAKTSNLSFFEDKAFGYRTDIDLARGSASIYKNWEKWPNPYEECKDGTCDSRSSLKAADLPSDEEIINAANDFLKAYKVDMSAYGSPSVNKNFIDYYAASGAEIYVPEEIAVIYPLIVDGKSVYESYGEINGLGVNYDARNRKISSMYNLMTHNYQASAYEAETDINKILEVAKNIDGTMPMRGDSEVTFKKVEIELDTPFLSYENLWKYESNQSAEYLVPCLVFPVKDNAELAYYSRKRVIVPLIKDFLNQNYGGPITIMKGGAAGTGGAEGVDSASSPVSTGSNSVDRK